MRKYIGPVKSDNFIYPNNVLEEYDVEIIHDINNNSVSGTTSGFSALYNAGTGNIGISFTYIWNRNGAEPFIDDSGLLHVLSVHMSDPSKKYYKPWRMISGVTTSSVTANTVTDTFLIIVTPAMMGVPYFTGGVYDFEVRFIGKKEIYPICQSVSVAVPTPTPTPTITGTPTPTATPGGPTFTPTATPTVTPTATPTDPCYCYPIVVTGTTVPGPEPTVIATLTYNDCFGTQVVRAFTVGPGTYYQCIQTLSSVVQYNPSETSGIDQSYLTLTYQTGNCRTGYVCSGYTPSGSTPTPTPTATTAPITATPTPTPTGSPITATPTPSPTPVVYTYSLGYDASVGYTACTDFSSSPTNYYSYDSTLTNGTTLYTTNGTPLTGLVPAGNYSNGTNVWASAGGGVLYGEAACATPTPTPSPTPIYQGIGIYTGATFGTSTSACNTSTSPSGTVYASVAELPISDGDRLYTTVTLTFNFSGNGNYYRLFFNSQWYAAIISSTGYISDLTACSTIPTPTPTPTAAPPTATPTVTPTPTPIVSNIIMYSGTSVSAACSNVTEKLYYYSGIIFGAGTKIFTDSGLTDAVPGTSGAPRYYRDGTDVYSVTDSEGTLNSPVPCATPTPTATPIPSTYDVYERCDLTAIYYVDYSAGNLNFVTINSECCSRIVSNVDSAYIAANYPSAIYFASFTNVTCPCE